MSDITLSSADAINREWQLAMSSADIAIDHAMECGRLLNEEFRKHKHGGWMPWLKANFKGSHATAKRWMADARNGGKKRMLSHIAPDEAGAKTTAPKDKDEEVHTTPPPVRPQVKEARAAIDALLARGEKVSRTTVAREIGGNQPAAREAITLWGAEVEFAANKTNEESEIAQSLRAEVAELRVKLAANVGVRQPGDRIHDALTEIEKLRDKHDPREPAYINITRLLDYVNGAEKQIQRHMLYISKSLAELGEKELRVKVEALAERGATDGERAAGTAALGRMISYTNVSLSGMPRTREELLARKNVGRK